MITSLGGADCRWGGLCPRRAPGPASAIECRSVWGSPLGPGRKVTSEMGPSLTVPWGCCLNNRNSFSPSSGDGGWRPKGGQGRGPPGGSGGPFLVSSSLWWFPEILGIPRCVAASSPVCLCHHTAFSLCPCVSSFFFFLPFRVTPSAYGGSQARGQIRAAPAGLHHSHSSTRPEPRLRPTSQLTATPDP